MRRFPECDLYCLTAEEHSRSRSNITVVTEMMDAGIQVVQYREKDKAMKEKYEECLRIREITEKAGATFIVNDDVALAIAVGADGIHVGQGDMPLPVIRRLAGEKMLIGLSTHSPEQAEEAVRLGADYIGAGPIFSTQTKKDVCDPVGFEYLEYVAANIDIPFVAIGGIKAHNVREIAKRGARCIAMVTEIVGSPDIKEKIAEVRGLIAASLPADMAS